jgi:hypothetical protein
MTVCFMITLTGGELFRDRRKHDIRVGWHSGGRFWLTIICREKIFVKLVKPIDNAGTLPALSIFMSYA